MLQNGETFAGYVIRRVLGQGGMGTVYLARHPRLPRLTALKVLERDLYSDVEIRGRFEREADLVARLDHPNIVTVYDRGAEDDQLWISMQFVAGSDAASVDVNVLAPWRAVQIVGETAAALDFAHANGVLHRDVKPANILLAKAPIGQPERVLLTDFGIARPRDADTTLGSAGTITATLAYASPEQLSGSPLDHRCDQYSLACTLFWMLAGTAPFNGTSPAAVMNGHLYGKVPPLRPLRAGIPPALDNVLAKALAKRPEDRFENCVEFARAARRALMPTGQQRMPTGPRPVTRSGYPQGPPPHGGMPYPAQQHGGSPPNGYPVRPHAPGPGNPRTSVPRGPVQPNPPTGAPPGHGQPPRQQGPVRGPRPGTWFPGPGAPTGSRPQQGAPPPRGPQHSGVDHGVVPPYPRQPSGTRHGQVPSQPYQGGPPAGGGPRHPRPPGTGAQPVSGPGARPDPQSSASRMPRQGNAVRPGAAEPARATEEISRATEEISRTEEPGRTARAGSGGKAVPANMPANRANPPASGPSAAPADPSASGASAAPANSSVSGPSSGTPANLSASGPSGASSNASGPSGTPARPASSGRPARPITIDLPELRGRRVPPPSGSPPGGQPSGDPRPPP